MTTLYATDIFNGDGQETEFDLSFQFIDREHVQVVRIVKSDGAETALTVIETGTPVGNEYRWENDTRIRVGVAPTAEEQLRIQRDTPENQQLVPWSDGSYLLSEDLNTSDLQWLYGLQELEDKFGLLQTTAIKYLGAIDLTVDEAPAAPEGGDFFINTGDGSVLPSWTGIAGDLVVGSEQVIYNASLLEWEIFEVPSSKIGVVEVEGTAPIVVDDTDSQRPVVSITGATASADGSMSAADKAKLDGISPGATVGIPDAPSDGDQYARKDAAWSAIDIPPETIVSPTPPANPIESQLWFDSTDGRTYVYYTDTDSSQWVESNPSWNGSIPDGSVTTPKLEDGSVTPEKLDREYVEQIVAGNNVTITPSTGKGVVTINSTGGGGGPTTPGVRYQQGTWTPTTRLGGIENISYATWSRIGNTVTLTARLASFNNSSSSQIDILNLPYSPTPADNTNWTGGCMTSKFSNPATVSYLASPGYISFYKNSPDKNNTWRAIQYADRLDGNSTIVFSLSYTTDDTTFAPVAGSVVTEDIQGTGGSGGGGGTTVNYNGASAWGDIASNATINASLNISSVVRNSTGFYTVTFTTPMATNRYAITVGGNTPSVETGSRTINGFDINTNDSSGNPDSKAFSFAIHAENAIAPPSGVGADAWACTDADGTLLSGYNLTVEKVDNSGRYQYTFVTPMPNSNYAVIGSNNSTSSQKLELGAFNKTTSGFRVQTYTGSTGTDAEHGVAVHASSTVTPTYTWTRDGTTLKPANDGDLIEAGGDASSGVRGVQVSSDGYIFGCRSGSQILFAGHNEGNASSTSSIVADGSATFDGLIRSIGTYNNTSGSSNDLGVSSGGAFYRSTSSGRFKSGVETMEPEYADAILNCRPVYYHSTCAMDDPSLTHWGFIAEEVGEIDPRLVKWSELEDGTKQAEGVAYDRFVPHLVNLIQRQNTRIEALEAKVQSLEGGTNS